MQDTMKFISILLPPWFIANQHQCDFVKESKGFSLYHKEKQKEFYHVKKESGCQHPGMRCLRMLHKSLSTKRDHRSRRHPCGRQQGIMCRMREMCKGMPRKYYLIGGDRSMKGKKKWYDYLWIASLTCLILGFFNILLHGWGFYAFLFLLP